LPLPRFTSTYHALGSTVAAAAGVAATAETPPTSAAVAATATTPDHQPRRRGTLPE
jgi:hypothetical protein